MAKVLLLTFLCAEPNARETQLSYVPFVVALCRRTVRRIAATVP